MRKAGTKEEDHRQSALKFTYDALQKPRDPSMKTPKAPKKKNPAFLRITGNGMRIQEQETRQKIPKKAGKGSLWHGFF